MRQIALALVFGLLTASPSHAVDKWNDATCLAVLVTWSNPDIVTPNAVFYYHAMIYGLSAGTRIPRMVEETFTQICYENPTYSVGAVVRRTAMKMEEMIKPKD